MPRKAKGGAPVAPPATSHEAGAESVVRAALETPAAAMPSAPAPNDAAYLVPMTKGGNVLRIHPSCVAEHQSLGWALA